MLKRLALAVIAITGLAFGLDVLLDTMVRYSIPRGPLVTQLAWLALWLGCTLRSRPCPFADQVSWYELAPAAIASVFVQLLLDMRRPYLGDAIIVALHAIALIVVLAIAQNARRNGPRP